ncbi:lytic murein transglycosylase [Methylocucumis oryzae]|uniref:lytic murein transglycosylase n=1 Tax=Methylocucumis oryzae TaxID=1632867 RepID=UPI0023BAAFB7|nr:lytic murein transglycosylase [Methylocucumis oryzae]
MTEKLITTVLSLALSACVTPQSESLKTAFMRNMIDKHGYDQQQLHALFDNYQPNQDIIDKMNKPAEALPWHRYRKIFSDRNTYSRRGKILART